MLNRLTVDLGLLPEEGMPIKNQLNSDFFELPEGDAQPAGPVDLDVWVTRYGNEVLVRGKVSVPMEFECVRTLHHFVQTIELEEMAISVEVEDGVELDLTEALREEIILAFPAYPRCDEGDAPEACNLDSRYLAVDKEGDDEVSTPPPAANQDVWSALDRLQ